MKQILVDTHTFMWFVNGSNRLNNHAKDVIEKAEIKYLSVVSVWEMAIKISMKKLDIKMPFNYLQTVLEDDDFTLLPIKFEHTAQLIDLPFHHKDPFDRLLIAQAMAEKLPIVSIDGHFSNYEVQIIW